ncbi:hypothetical protein ALC62_06881 [Cyphomyrmex costatus]|uniref:Uncharacterized protein n=1 Tax=Cyphomyrmex costatus TaxID=456900 RepID=A0A151IIT8_9HYME|nr:hypothetical protein ALC62_06881 [Cyphomyrmex costatus]
MDLASRERWNSLYQFGLLRVRRAREQDALPRENYLYMAKQYNHGTCNCIFLKRSFFRVTSREEVVMQLALGRKGSANHPTCLFSFGCFSFYLHVAFRPVTRAYKVHKNASGHDLMLFRHVTHPVRIHRYRGKRVQEEGRGYRTCSPSEDLAIVTKREERGPPLRRRGIISNTNLVLVKEDERQPPWQQPVTRHEPRDQVRRFHDNNTLLKNYRIAFPLLAKNRCQYGETILERPRSYTRLRENRSSGNEELRGKVKEERKLCMDEREWEIKEENLPLGRLGSIVNP